MLTPLSVYVLTYNSDRHLDSVLTQINKIADEIIILDSGSNDETLAIAEKYNARIYSRVFDDFIQQRTHAVSLCKHDWILFVDSDEWLDAELVREINSLKVRGLGVDGHDAYQLKRDWHVLGRPVHAIYPIKSPDYRIRLYHKGKGYFDKTAPVHEKLIGFASTIRIKSGSIQHYTFATLEEFDRKLDRYLDLAIEAMILRGKHTSRGKAYVHAGAAFLKSYLMYQGWRDGGVGLICGRYAYRYTLAKYLGLLARQKS